MRISVIVPCYNCAKTIESSVASIHSELSEEDEIILVDDKSKDDTLKVLLRLADQFTNVVVIESVVNAGAGAARNKGLHYSRNELVAFCDSDDRWISGKIKLQRQILQEHDVTWTASAYYKEILGKRTPINVTEGLITHSGLAKGQPFCFSSVLLKKTCVPEFREYPARQDYAFMLDYSRVNGSGYLLNDKLVIYSITKGSISRNKVKAAKAHLMVLKSHTEFKGVGLYKCFIIYVFNSAIKYLKY